VFDSSIDSEIVNQFNHYTKVLNEQGELIGYTINTDRGLRSLLSNPAYAGYWLYKGAVVRSNNHEAIIDYGLFIYAYSRLSATNLDGTPNEEVLERRKQYVKRHYAERPAYLKNHLVSADSRYKIYTSAYQLLVKGTKGKEKRIETFYGFYIHENAWNRFQSKYMIVTRDVDDIFMSRLRQRLEQADEFENFLEYEQKELQEQLQLQEDIDRDIKAAKSQMARIEKQVELGELTNPEFLKKANATYTSLQEDIARLRERQRDMTMNKTQTQQRRTYKQLMHDAGEAWKEIITPDVIPLMIDTFVKKVVLEPLTPHFYKMAIHWHDPEWGIDEGLCYRDGSASIRWTEEEDKLLREHYSTAPREELMKMLPTRNIRAMATRAYTYGLLREIREQEPDIPTTLCWRDYQIMQQYRLIERELSTEKGGKLIMWACPRLP
jgi:hypothetical protein